MAFLKRPDVEGMVKLLNKLERASSELHSDEESDAKHHDTITDMACLQARKISNLVVSVGIPL